MTMKTKHILLGLSLGLLGGFTACDVTDLNPKDSITDNSYWNTVSDLENYAKGFYMNLTGKGLRADGSENLDDLNTLDERSDNRLVASPDQWLFNEWVIPSEANFDSKWYWNNIRNLNYFMTRYQRVNATESEVNPVVAVIRFFRAFDYFDKIKTFGDVPYYTTFYSSADADMMLPRTEKATVYKLIESDLQEAVKELPAVKTADNGHRVTKYAAAMLLTDVYMYQNNYAEAAKTAKIVIDSPHKLVDNDDLAMGSAYNKLRTTDDLDEAIFVREANASISTNDWLPTYSVTSSFLELKDVKYAITERVYGPSDRFLNIYESNDLRRQPNQFFHWEYTQASTGKKWSDKNAACWYWFDEEALLTSGKGTKDWNYYRYAEALLDGAEAIAQTSGVTTEAASYLAQIKARANMQGETVQDITDELKTMGKEAFIQECWRERLREMPLEFKIWDDCVRTKMFPVVSETTPGKIDFVPLVGATNGSGAKFTENDLLWPIATTEIQRNPNLEQNLGYSRE